MTASAGGGLSGDLVFNTSILTITGGATPIAPPPPPSPPIPTIPPVLYTPPQPLNATPLSMLAGPNTTGMFQIGYSAAFEWTTFFKQLGNEPGCLGQCIVNTLNASSVGTGLATTYAPTLLRAWTMAGS